MPKNIDDVILPERRRSIRNIPIPAGRRQSDRMAARVSDAVAPASMDGVRRGPAPRATLSAEESVESPLPPRYPRGRSGGFAGKRVWIAALAACVILAFAILSLFNGATLAYLPRSTAVAFAGETYSAYKTADTGLLYSVVKLSGDKGVSVPASGESDVSRKASGTIVVYNNASAEPQQLVENTRFESADGKVYRIAKAISIPGKKSSGPGSIEAVVFADVPGAAHNIGLTDFTLPGLKGSARFETIYARSKTPMTGGFVGKEKGVSEADLTKAKADLRAALAEELLTKAQAEVPVDFILFPSLSSVTFEELPQSAAGGNSVNVNMRGHLYGIMFKKSDLSSTLSISKANTTPQDPVEIESFSSLEVTFAGTPPTDLLNLNKIDFKVTGNGLVVWRTDEVSLKSALVGKDNDEIPQILQNYPTIETATATVRPFWKRSFPDDISKITIKKLKVE